MVRGPWGKIYVSFVIFVRCYRGGGYLSRFENGIGIFTHDFFSRLADTFIVCVTDDL